MSAANQESIQQQPYPQAYYEDEINLIDYLLVLWKWKRLIIAGTLICTVIAIVISFQMPRIYEVSMAVEPGIAGVKEDGSFIYIDSVANLNGKIAEGIYNKRVEKALQLDPLKAMVKFKSVIIKKANIINITSQWQEKDTDLGVRATRQLLSLLSNDYGNIIEQRKGNYDKQISMKQNEISNIETQRKDIDQQIKLKRDNIEGIQNNIKLRQATLENISQRREELLTEIKGVKDNMEKIAQQRDSLLEGKNLDKNTISFLLYFSTIQQNVVYFNQLSNQIYDLGASEKKIEVEIERLNKGINEIKMEIERLYLSKTEGLQTDINDINAQINTLNLEKGLIGNIKVIQEPEVSLHPVKPKKKQIVLLAGVVALFMFVFLAFFVEYIKNASKSN